MKDFKKILLFLGLIINLNLYKKENEFLENIKDRFMTTTYISKLYDGPKIELTKFHLTNGMLSYKAANLDSMNQINSKITDLGKKMIITTIAKEWLYYLDLNIKEGKIKNNPNNKLVFDFDKLDLTATTLFEFEKRYNIEWKSVAAHSLLESVFDQLPYGTLDEIGKFHIRTKIAEKYFNYVKKKFIEDDFAQEILGESFEAEKLKNPFYNTLFYIAFMDDKLRSSEKIEDALKKYNAGIFWNNEKFDFYPQKIKNIISLLYKYERYAIENPKGFAFFYLSTLFPEFKTKGSVKNEFWLNQDYVWKFLYEKYRYNKKIYYEFIYDTEKKSLFEKHYNIAKEFIDEAELIKR
ncbi:MAG: hypothetical protein N3G19_02110 [Candidatus Pacearchaeota archaeon]|nr:hypothetical protein [Candidatus Pacearchaeota archaeon]